MFLGPRVVSDATLSFGARPVGSGESESHSVMSDSLRPRGL